ncbi:MAG TPA: nucleoside deaminase [Clostridia bacterium]|nr:nucleoside deaminase [Clostridia bacterium]
MSLTDIECMRFALDEARRALDEGEMPVGCVIAKGGELVASAHNTRERAKDPTAHAEILALRSCAERLQDWRLDGCVLYVTLEPCPMCAAATALARIQRVVFAAYDFDNGAVGSNGNMLTRPIFGYAPEVVSGLLRADSEAVLQQFFAHIRSKRRGG